MSHKRAKEIRNAMPYGLDKPKGEFVSTYLLGRGMCQVWIPSDFRRHYQKVKRQFKTNQQFRMAKKLTEE